MSESAARHIPDDELHAYLDQALSRSQCVEIECHLAECRTCRSDRDRVAAIRDHITALLAEATPGRIVAPPYETLVARHQVRVAARQAWLLRARRAGLLAAGLVFAVGAGWLTRDRGLGPEVSPVAAPTSGRTLVALGPVQVVPDSTEPPAVSPIELGIGVSESGLVRAVTEATSEPQVTPVTDDGFVLDGLWQSVDFQQAASETGGTLPRVTGYPVVDIQMQRTGGDERPVLVVTQQHPSGRLIRTIEGPIERVEEMIGRYVAGTSLNASGPVLTPPDYIGGGAAARRGLRILTVTGALQADTLNAMAKAIDVRD